MISPYLVNSTNGQEHLKLAFLHIKTREVFRQTEIGEKSG